MPKSSLLLFGVVCRMGRFIVWYVIGSLQVGSMVRPMIMIIAGLDLE